MMRLRGGDPNALGWTYLDDYPEGLPGLNFTPIGPVEALYVPCPREQVAPLMPAPGMGPACLPRDMPYMGRDPSDPSTWGGRPYSPAQGMIARLNLAGSCT